jgi:hypothetical protein
MEDNLKKMVDDFGTDDEKQMNENEMLNPTEQYVEPQKEKKQTKQPKTVEAPVVEEDSNSIPLTNLQLWMGKHSSEIRGFSALDVKTGGVDKNEILVFKLPLTGEEAAGEKRELFLLKKPYNIRVPDLSAALFTMLDDVSFKMVQPLIPDLLYLRSYSSRSVLFSSVCLNVNNQLIPIEKVKIKRKEEKLTFNIDLVQAQNLVSKFRETLVKTINIEDVCILYKQAMKTKDTLKTYQDVLSWLNKRHAITKDINH